MSNAELAIKGPMRLTTTDAKKIYMAGDTGLFGDIKLLAPEHVIPINFGSWDVIAQNLQDWAARVE